MPKLKTMRRLMPERLGQRYEDAPSTDELTGRAEQRQADRAAAAAKRQRRSDKTKTAVKAGLAAGVLAVAGKAGDRVLENPSAAPDMSGIARNIELKESADRAVDASRTSGETTITVDGKEHTLYVAPRSEQEAASQQTPSS